MGNLFDFTTEEAQEEINLKPGFTPAKPGINFFELTDVQLKDETNDIVFQFKGTRKEELGSFSAWINASNFDSSDERYNEKMAGWVKNQIVHIVKAFLSDEEMLPITSVAHAGYVPFIRSVMKALTPDKYKGVEAQFKLLISHKDAVDEKYGGYKTQIPLFPKFISTDLRPFALAVNSKLNQNGEPYERIAPLSELNIEGTTDAPDSGFGGGDDNPSFGGFGE